MNFQELISHLADGDVPGIEFTRKAIPLWVIASSPYPIDYWDLKLWIKSQIN